jgi:hypothetical protein
MLKEIKDREIDPAVYDKAIDACRLICLGYETAWNSNAELLSAYRAASEALVADRSRRSRLRLVPRPSSADVGET